MAHFWLRFIDNSAPGSPQYMRFNGVRSTQDIQATRIITQGKRGYKYEHTLYVHNVWNLTISADELYQDSKFEWLQDFWKAHRWWFSDSDTIAQPDDSMFIECIIPDGRLPVEYLNNHKRLRQVAFDMSAIAPT
jgi:hypothetical protein